MSTKAEERKALEQIKKIVSDLGGADSYLGMAFEGCFEIAEDNIGNDFGCSMKQRLESAEKNCDELRQLNAGLEKRNTELERELDEQKKITDRERDLADKWKCDAVELENERDAVAEREHELEGEVLELNRRVKDQEFEIMVLKAKLYDLTVGKEG